MIVKRSLSIRGHRTSISLEDAFWALLREMAERRNLPLARLVADIDTARDPEQNLSSSLRLAVLDYALDKGRERA
ncbi:Ribbon-helix-helix domain-containing protein [Aureimonas altamirensis DSM 21988]|uniref:Ribbon-helix-helix domain-containing protein n=1 Tax=Aureimonas altamirensis DSM 21988 TaxID=1121026 RepID=A0ABY1IMV1_9HYPH|nr:ribbon-helix-helix domain-containing protein [Aureimonas altamirensis]SHJ50796.1 Ribbon-helix-helix domain-containing protein [Aureimonas altamirensis DSM 21988]